jgi:hypothetical protein
LRIHTIKLGYKLGAITVQTNSTQLKQYSTTLGILEAMRNKLEGKAGSVSQSSSSLHEIDHGSSRFQGKASSTPSKGSAKKQPLISSEWNSILSNEVGKVLGITMLE